jgi:two-component system, NarL family, sensor histidine kinase UhpB
VSRVRTIAARFVRLACSFGWLLILAPSFAATAATGSLASATPPTPPVVGRQYGSSHPYVVAGALVFSAQCALIVGLVMQRGMRRQAEADARRSEARYRSVIETQTELICRFLPDTTLTFVNDAYCRFFRRTPDQLLGTKFVDLIPDASRNEVLARIALIGPGDESHEHPVRLPDGTIGWHHWTNQPIFDDRGRLTELQGIGRDITDRKRAEETAGRFEARNTAILRAIPDLMFVIMRDGTYIDYHARDPKMLFAPPEQFIGKTVREIIPPPTADLLMAAIESACRSRNPVVVEYELLHDEPRCYEARVVHAEENCVLTIVRDVTEAKRTMAVNRDLAGRLIASQELERTRIARELHDGVCQDVAAISIDLTHLRNKCAIGPDGQDVLFAVERRVSEVADALRHLSHGLHPSVLQHIGLVAALRSHCSEVARQHRISVHFDETDDVEPANRIVRLSLFRIAQEALRNVVRHACAQHATLSLARNGNHLVMAVRDDGIGFDPAQVRQHDGLGLVSIEERARLVQGRAIVRTRPGHGTEVAVTVPIQVVDSVDSRMHRRSERFDEAAQSN